MAWMIIDNTKIKLRVGAGETEPHSFLPGDISKVFNQDKITVNAIQIIPVKLIAAHFDDLSADKESYAIIGMEVEGEKNTIINEFSSEGQIVALPCPPFIVRGGSEVGQ